METYEYPPFTSLKSHYLYVMNEFIWSENTDMMGMFSKTGNNLIWSMCYVAINCIHANLSREQILDRLKVEWNMTAKAFPEAWDTVVVDNVFYYLNPVCDWHHVDRFSKSEIKIYA